MVKTMGTWTIFTIGQGSKCVQFIFSADAFWNGKGVVGIITVQVVLIQLRSIDADLNGFCVCVRNFVQNVSISVYSVRTKDWLFQPPSVEPGYFIRYGICLRQFDKRAVWWPVSSDKLLQPTIVLETCRMF